MCPHSLGLSRKSCKGRWRGILGGCFLLLAWRSRVGEWGQKWKGSLCCVKTGCRSAPGQTKLIQINKHLALERLEELPNGQAFRRELLTIIRYLISQNVKSQCRKGEGCGITVYSISSSAYHFTRVRGTLHWLIEVQRSLPIGWLLQYAHTQAHMMWWIRLISFGWNEGIGHWVELAVSVEDSRGQHKYAKLQTILANPSQMRLSCADIGWMDGWMAHKQLLLELACLCLVTMSESIRFSWVVQPMGQANWSKSRRGCRKESRWIHKFDYLIGPSIPTKQKGWAEDSSIWRHFGCRIVVGGIGLGWARGAQMAIPKLVSLGVAIWPNFVFVNGMVRGIQLIVGVKFVLSSV